MPGLVELQEAFRNAVGHQPFAPGLDDGRIDELLRASGLTLPAEVRAYFRAHDGVHPPSRVQAPWLIGHWLPLPLEEARRVRGERMRRPGRPVPTSTMTLAEAARVLGIDPALAPRLAEDGQFPVPVVRGDDAYRLPVRHVAMLSRVLRLPQHPAPWRTAAVADANVARAGSGRAQSGWVRKGSRWPGPS